MDEEEKRRQASAAAFGGSAAPAGYNEPRPTPNLSPDYEDPNVAVQMNRQRGTANGATPAAERAASQQDTFASALQNRRDADAVANNYPEVQAASWQQTGQIFGNIPSVPGASEAFGQLDSATPSDPTQFDERMAEGTQDGVANVLRQSFDENLKAARDAVAGQARRDRFGGEMRRAGGQSSEISQYRDRLLKMADQTLSGVGAGQNQPQDPYAAQREREALVAKRLGTFDLFSDAKTTRTPISAETIQTNAYDKVLMGKDNKDLFDSFL